MLWTILLLPIAMVNTIPSTLSHQHLPRSDEDTDDTVYSGNFAFQDCSAGYTVPRATYLQSFLPHIHNVIQSVLVDLRHGTASRHGFSAFFKTTSNIAVVKDVFLHMLNGTPIPDIENLGAAYPPTFRCVNNVTSDQRLLDACTNLEAVAYVYRDKEFVILCPFFWSLITDYSLRWPPSRYCPRIINNEVMPNDKLLGINQFASIVHELAHMYIDAPMWESRTGPTINPPSEVLRLGDCVALNATASIKNAQSYALYAAAVYAGCTDFPGVPHTRPHHTDGELKI